LSALKDINAGHILARGARHTRAIAGNILGRVGASIAAPRLGKKFRIIDIIIVINIVVLTAKIMFFDIFSGCRLLYTAEEIITPHVNIPGCMDEL